jgi:hypothetical protein
MNKVPRTRRPIRCRTYLSRLRARLSRSLLGTKADFASTGCARACMYRSAVGLGRIFIYLFFTVIALLGSIGVTILVAKLWGRRLFSMVGPEYYSSHGMRARPAVD